MHPDNIGPLNAYNNPVRYFTDDDEYRVLEMFLETNDDHAAWRQFTLQTRPVWYRGHEYPSLHQAYVEANDPTEYIFANTHFYDYTHWVLIRTHPVIRPYYDAMRQELTAKLSSLAIQSAMQQIQSGKASTATIKYITNGEYMTEIAEPHRTAELHLIEVSDDLKRIS